MIEGAAKRSIGLEGPAVDRHHLIVAALPGDMQSLVHTIRANPNPNTQMSLKAAADQTEEHQETDRLVTSAPDHHLTPNGLIVQDLPLQVVDPDLDLSQSIAVLTLEVFQNPPNAIDLGPGVIVDPKGTGKSLTQDPDPNRREGKTRNKRKNQRRSHGPHLDHHLHLLNHRSHLEISV